ncbi:MAG: tRNA epoxyqueuosine(34) reductase QueG [Bacteriovoracia bacterium]
MKTNIQSIKEIVFDLAKQKGFDLVGVADPKDPSLKEAISRYKHWLDHGYAASMHYLHRHKEKKENPEEVLANCKSIICLGLSYSPNKNEIAGNPKISSYTSGLDYHEIIREKLENYCKDLQKVSPMQSFIFVDSSPVLERFWAWRAGLGWIGKNSLVLNRKKGSYFFISGIFTTLEIEPDSPGIDHCGKCRRCIDACPTEAIITEKEKHPFVDSNLCIAYHTIENKNDVPTDLHQKFQGWIAGCDVCQQVCPWNSKITIDPEVVERFGKQNLMTQSTFEELESWTEEEFKKNTKGTALSRIKYKNFKRNILIGKQSLKLL